MSETAAMWGALSTGWRLCLFGSLYLDLRYLDAYIAQWVLYEYLSMSKVDMKQIGDSVTLVGSAEDPGEAPGHGFIQCNRKLT